MEKRYILALDQGTTSSRAILFDRDTIAVRSKAQEFPQIYPKPGWVEHDPEVLFNSQLTVMQEALAAGADGPAIPPGELAALGITNQRETVVLWERKTGRPVYNAIVWQCRRTAALCEELVRDGMMDIIRERTGLLIDAYFSATKIKWLLDTIPGLRKRAKKGEILAGTIDTWLIWKLTGGEVYATDFTNASRTMLYNIYLHDWDDELLRLMDIPRCMLPDVHNSSEIFGNTDPEVCGFSIPIGSAVGDQQAALFGQGCFNKGDTKNTYGTGCFMLMNTGDKPVVSENLLTTIALGMDGKIQYALEGSVFIGGAVIKWLRDELELIGTAQECDTLAETVPDSNGVYLVPAFVGLGAPHWDMYARGTITGLTRGVRKAHICRAALEGIAYQVKEMLECMIADSGHPLTSIKVDGGASVSDVMLQFQADILNTPVLRPANTETTALGAAFLAGLASGFWRDKNEILARQQQSGKIFNPVMEEAERERLYGGWKKAVDRALRWESPSDGAVHDI
ncbi:MAG: glycerol kinase GlpK [Spirochaetaceae bacterium]|jgi:glycerol kinase|nr:glycerol kinase GlpK [Spirochaetaceae bacterium]